MRAKEFIIEYDRGMTLKSWEQKLTARMASDQSAPDTIDEIMEMIESADPTRNKMYTQWIVKRYVAGDFNIDDLDQVKSQLTEYDAVKKSLTTGKDINQLTYAQLPAIISAGQTQKSAPKFEVVPESTVLYNGPLGQLAIPRTEEASCELGKQTNWCTARTESENHFDEYDDPLYVWRDKNGKKYQFYWSSRSEFKNSANQDMSTKDFIYFRSTHPILSKLFAEQEEDLLYGADPEAVGSYYTILKKGYGIQWDEGKSIVGNAELESHDYPYSMEDGRQPELEPEILEDDYYALAYAMYVIDDRWPEFESKILANPSSVAILYAEDVIGGKWPELEKVITDEPILSYNYAVRVLGDRFPAGEAAIATNENYAKIYDDEFGTNLAQQ